MEYGNCPICREPLEPEYFIEKEYKITQDGIQYYTGRIRYAVDYLICPMCFTKQCVDDTFDGPWR